MKKIGLITSGGDCPGLNAALRGVVQAVHKKNPEVEFIGIEEGYLGLIEGHWHKMNPEEFSPILNTGGTILGTSRQPFKEMELMNEKYKATRLDMMLKNFKKGNFDALVILGGNGSQKSANLLHQHGVPVVSLPKTIDNDLYGSDLTFGFDTGVARATEMMDAIATTAASHNRIFIVEIMGHKVGWLALYAGIAGNADMILLPEMPYDTKYIIQKIKAIQKTKQRGILLAMAEGAFSSEEMKLSKKERKALEATSSASERLSSILSNEISQEIRTVVPGHFQRGGNPTPMDRILASRLGAFAGEMLLKGDFGNMSALKDGEIISIPLSEIAGKLKTVPLDSDIIQEGKLLGISFGSKENDKIVK